eukprot:4043539-Ditylum_brightwellii.AAC.1
MGLLERQPQHMALRPAHHVQREAPIVAAAATEDSKNDKEEGGSPPFVATLCKAPMTCMFYGRNMSLMLVGGRQLKKFSCQAWQS